MLGRTLRDKSHRGSLPLKCTCELRTPSGKRRKAPFCSTRQWPCRHCCGQVNFLPLASARGAEWEDTAIGESPRMISGALLRPLRDPTCAIPRSAPKRCRRCGRAWAESSRLKHSAIWMKSRQQPTAMSSRWQPWPIVPMNPSIARTVRSLSREERSLPIMSSTGTSTATRSSLQDASDAPEIGRNVPRETDPGILAARQATSPATLTDPGVVLVSRSTLEHLSLAVCSCGGNG